MFFAIVFGLFLLVIVFWFGRLTCCLWVVCVAGGFVLVVVDLDCCCLFGYWDCFIVELFGFV